MNTRKPMNQMTDQELSNLKLIDCDNYTTLRVGRWTQDNNGCKKQKKMGFISANVYRNKKNPRWFDCRFSKSDIPTNKMNRAELEHWEFIGVARK